MPEVNPPYALKALLSGQKLFRLKIFYNSLQKLLVTHAILVVLRPWLSREQCGKPLVEFNKLLGVLAAFKFVLRQGNNR